LFTVLQKR